MNVTGKTEETLGNYKVGNHKNIQEKALVKAHLEKLD